MNIITIKKTGKLTLIISTAFYFFVCSSLVQAQRCRSSEMFYIVRDANGTIINPANLDAPDFIEDSVMAIEYAEAEKKRQGYWGVGESVKKAREQKLGNLEKERGSLFVLHQSGGGNCYFEKPVEYRLTLGKTTMNLIFRFAENKNELGKAYLIDSLPFEQGTFEIDLVSQEGYVSPNTWRKTSNEAEKPAPIASHHIRGRIINAVTKKPIQNAVVIFETSPGYYRENYNKNKSVVKTDATGRFAFENLRGDYFATINEAAVFVKHSDFVVNTNTYLFHRVKENEKPDETRIALVSGKNVSLNSRDNLTIELTPLVTVSGRVVDAATGERLPDAESLPKQFSINAEYGGGYIGGNISIPRSEVKVSPQPDGTFTLLTAPGKNEFGAGGKLAGRTYYLVANQKKINVGNEGLKDLVLKVERASWEANEEFKALVKQGNEHFAATRYEDALKSFQVAAQLKPDEISVHLAIIQSYVALKRIDEAVSIYQKAVTVKPDNAVSQYALGVSFDRAGKPGEAVKHFKEAVRLAPNVAIHRYNLGNVLGALGQSENAINELKEAIRLDPKYVAAHTILGMEYQTLGRYEESIVFLSNAIRLNPTDEYALQSRSPTYLSLNRGAEAAADAENFITAHGWKNDQSIFLALFGSLGYRLDGKETEARKLLEMAAKNNDKNLWVAPAVEYLLGRLSADDLLKLAIDNDKMTEARAYIGINLLLLGKREEALPYLRWVVENGNKTFHEYHFTKAILERTIKQ